MARDIQEQVGRIGQFLDSDTGRQLVGAAASELLGGFGASKTTKAKNKAKDKAKKVARGGTKELGGVISDTFGDGLSGARGLAAGAGAAALAPVAIKGISKLVGGGGNGGSLASAPKKIAEGAAAGPKKLAEGAASKVGDKVTGKIDEAGGPSGILKDTVKSALPFGGGDGGNGGGKNDAQGVGKGRRMPIQQSIDIPLPVETVYNQWTQFDEWPKFMHRVKRVTQEDPCTVSFAVKIWGKTKEFTAKIETQRPDDRVKWKTSDGMTHAGVVMFRELGPNMTRVILSFDLDPGNLLEKYARGARYVKRAARADLHRFAAFIEMLENETGAWRGRIEDGELVEDHDPSYDGKREYSNADDLLGSGSDDDDDDEDESDDDEDEGQGRNGGDPERRGSRTRSSRSQGRSRASSSGSSSRSPRSASGSSRSSGGSSRRSSGSSRSSSGSSRSSSRSGGSAGGSSRSGSSRSSGSGRSSGSSSRSKSSGSRSSGSSGKTASGRRSSSGSRTSSRGSSGSSGRSSGNSSGSSRSSGGSSGSGRSSASKSSARSRSTGSSGTQSRRPTRSGSRS